MRASERKVHEWVFEAPTLVADARAGAPRDWRTSVDRLLLRRLRPVGPRWTLYPDAAELVAGGGATGHGSLWTRPLRLDAVARAEGAALHVLTRTTAGQGSAALRVVGHVRDRAIVGGERSVAAHGVDVDAADGAWRGTAVDLTRLVDASLGTGRFLTCEVRADVVAGRAARDVAVQVRPPALALTLERGGPTALVGG